MEHRQGSRLPLEVDVEIHCRSNGSHSTRTINVSQRGMLVQTEHCALNLYDVVGVVFPQGTGGNVRAERYKAFVVHSDKGYAGLMLTAGYIDLERLANAATEDRSPAEETGSPLLSGPGWKSVA